ncbi:MAG: hypothetical protein ACXVPY_00300, partial [Bacteroidia bacterium]
KTLFFFLLMNVNVSAQKNYFGTEASCFGIKPAHSGNTVNGLYEKTNRTEGNNFAVTYRITIASGSSINLGVGLSKISFQKEMLGIFPETNQFGLAEINGQISYWTFPLSYSLALPAFSRSTYKHSRIRNSIRICYAPSFEGKNSKSINTFGGAELSSFSSAYRLNEQEFQHSLLISFGNQFYFASKNIRISIDPFAGIGTGYFKESGTSIRTLSYGINLSLEFKMHLPTITIEKETDKGNEEEKKKLLEQKQKEIEDQLNKNPK